MIKKMKYYTVTVREEIETPVCVRANTEERAIKLAYGLYWQRSDDRRVCHGAVDNCESWVTKVEEEEIEKENNNNNNNEKDKNKRPIESK